MPPKLIFDCAPIADRLFLVALGILGYLLVSWLAVAVYSAIGAAL